MLIEAPGAADWAVFRAWAAAEHWRIPDGELELYGPAGPGQALLLRDGGETCGFVTVMAHERSGWIGNLLVAPAARGRGFGAILFDRAVALLEEAGTAQLWLTASEQGRPLYGRRGFRQVDVMVRWVARGVAGLVGEEAAAGELLFQADRQAWGEARRGLLAPLAARGEVFASGVNVLLLQGGETMRVLGPWYAPEGCPRGNRQLLAAALAAAGTAEVVADVPASAPLAGLLLAAGFRETGRNLLMVRGDSTRTPAGLMSLASLGSMG